MDRFMLVYKSPGWNNQKHSNGHFSAKNIRFKNEKKEICILFIKVLVGIIKNIRTDTFQPKIFGSKMKKKKFVYFS
jgi:hypothetical protein